MSQAGDIERAKGRTGRPPKRIDVAQLLDGAREAILLHEGEEYRLRRTSNGKLILTK